MLPHITCLGGWERFLDTKSPDFRAAIEATARLLAAAGHVSVEEHRGVDPDGHVFVDFLEVLGQNWKSVRAPTMATSSLQRFYKELTRRMVTTVHLWLLRIDGRPVASE